MPLVTPSTGEVSIPELIEKTREFGKTVIRGRRLFLRPLAVTVACGLLFAFARQNEYSASTTLLPYRSGSSAGALAGLAGLAGVRLPVGTQDQTITADLYPVIATTLDFRMSVANTPLHFTRTGKPVTMIKYFEDHRSLLDATSDFFANLRYSLGSMSADDRRAGTSTIIGADGTPLRVFDKQYLKIVNGMDNQLIVSLDKKTSVISITGVMPSPYAAADLVQTASDRLMQRIIDYEAKKAAEQLTFIEEQYSQAKTRYEQSQQNLAAFSDRNRALISPLSQIERDRLQNEYNVAFNVYQQLSGELQLARIKKNQDTPVFTVLDQVTVPDHRSSPRRTRILLWAILVGLGVGILRILYRKEQLTVSV